MTSQAPVVTPSVSTPALLLEGADSAEDIVTQLVVHPLVLLHVLDHHTRRNEAGGRVIGTLLGRRDGNKVGFTISYTYTYWYRGEFECDSFRVLAKVLARDRHGRPFLKNLCKLELARQGTRSQLILTHLFCYSAHHDIVINQNNNNVLKQQR